MENKELLLVARARRLSVTGEARQLRIDSGLSIREVAESVGVSPTALWRWERAQRMPRGAAAAAWGSLLRELAKNQPVAQ